MKSMKLLRVVALVSISVLGACSGVSKIGSGDEPGKAGGASTSVGGTKGEGLAGMGKGAEASGATSSTGATANMGGAGTVGGKDPGVGAEPNVELCMSDTDCENPGSPCEPCGDGTYSCNKVYCDGGKCVHTRDACKTMCADDKDCPVLGIACTKCGDGSVACPSTQCVKGQCQTSIPGCNDVDPCKGQACGAECKSCVDGMCDTKELSYCSAEGKCQPGLPQCGDPGMCKTPMDCGSAPPKCVPCGNDTCATFDCIQGSCVFACPPNPEPECKVTEDCKAVGNVCKMCPLGGCAVQACLSGSCELVCPL
jgi:hypothetical protein